MLSFPTQSRWQTAMLATKLSANSYAGLKLGTASAITPRIFLSDYFTARDEKVLNSLGITHVVSIVEQDPDIPTCIPEDHKMWISLADTPTANILAHLDSTTSFITEALANPSNKVLVHCFQGVSRSATAVIAYFVSTGMPVSDAVKFTQSKRGIVRPNMGFMKQLNTFAERYSHLPPPKQDNLFTKSIRKMKISDGVAARIRQLKSGEAP